MNAAQGSGLARDGGRNSPKLQPVEVGSLGTTSLHFATILQSPHEMSSPNRRQSRSAYDAPISSSVIIDYPPFNDVNIEDRTVPSALLVNSTPHPAITGKTGQSA